MFLTLQFPAKLALFNCAIFTFSLSTVCCLLCRSVKSYQPMHSQPWYSHHIVGWLHDKVETVHLTDQVQESYRVQLWEYNPTGEYLLESVYWFQNCKGVQFVDIYIMTGQRQRQRQYLSKMMTLYSCTGCYIDVHLYWRYIILSQVCCVSARVY